jgi:hypothetical protein
MTKSAEVRMVDDFLKKDSGANVTAVDAVLVKP